MPTKPVKKAVVAHKPPVQKKVAKKPVPSQAEPAKAGRPEKYFESLGRRKTSNARVRLFGGRNEKSFLINGKPFEAYFPTVELKEIVLSPLKLMDAMSKFGFSSRVKGGGVHSQAEAVRHGIAKCLVLIDGESRKTLKKAGFLTRDPRMRERKKFGLKRARRAPQWQKR